MAEPTNQDRADWAEDTLKHFGTLVYEHPQYERPNHIGDFLCDLFHFCERANINLRQAFDRAERLYRDEVIEDEAGEPHPEGHYKVWTQEDE